MQEQTSTTQCHLTGASANLPDADPPGENTCQLEIPNEIPNGATAVVPPPAQYRVPIPAPGEDHHEREKPFVPLNSEHLRAIDLLVYGHSDLQTANELGYHRNTITRWRLHHPVFRAQLARARQAFWLTLGDRFRAGANQALTIYIKGLASTDPRTALRAAAFLLRIAARGNRGGFAPPDESLSPDAYVRQHIHELRRNEGWKDDCPIDDEDYSRYFHQLVKTAYIHPEVPPYPISKHPTKEELIASDNPQDPTELPPVAPSTQPDA